MYVTSRHKIINVGQDHNPDPFQNDPDPWIDDPKKLKTIRFIKINMDRLSMIDEK